jgi:hypothetical protein
MEWFSTLSLALGSAWTSGINLYATVTVLGLLQKFGWARLPGGLDVLDNWWIIGVAGGLFIVEFFADKIPYVDSVWDVIHTFIRIPAGVIVAYGATQQLDPSIYIPAGLIGGGLATAAHGSKAALRVGANFSPEPVTNWLLSLAEDIVAIVGVLLAVFAPVVIMSVLGIFVVLFVYFAPKVFRAIRRMFRAVIGFFRGESFAEVAKKAG